MCDENNPKLENSRFQGSDYDGNKDFDVDDMTHALNWDDYRDDLDDIDIDEQCQYLDELMESRQEDIPDDGEVYESSQAELQSQLQEPLKEENVHRFTGHDDNSTDSIGDYYHFIDNENKTVVRHSNKGLLIFLCIMLGFVMLCGSYVLSKSLNGMSDTKSKSTISEEAKKSAGYSLEEATGAKLTVAEINDKVSESVVEITTEGVEYGGYGLGNYITSGAGSGVVFKENGYVITNKHVIENAQKINVKVGKKDYSASVVGVDSDVDIAVLKIDAKKLTPVVFGNSDNIRVGNMCVVIGNPLGSLGGSVTQGIISSKERELIIDDHKMKLFQTDASVNPGNSGGGVFNDEAQLIGVVVAKSSGTGIEGLGFAIPVNIVAEAADNIMKTGGDGTANAGDTAFTGISYREIRTDEEAQAFGVNGKGLYVAEILTKNASQAGFVIGDKMVKFDGKDVDSFEDYQKLVVSHKPGDTVKVIVDRDGKNVNLTLTLGSRFEYEKQRSSTGMSDNYSDGETVPYPYDDDIYNDYFN